MKKTIFFIVALAVGLCCACYEDKGNYDYLPTNKVDIDFGEGVYTLNAYLGETFYYTPKVTFADPTDTTGFEYWWENRGMWGLLGHHEVICEGRELQFLPPIVGSQTVALCIREPSTGVITSGTISINAVSRFADGWLILREESGDSKLSFVLHDAITGDYVPYVDIYPELFPDEPLGRGPVAIRQGFSGRGSECILYVIQDETVCLDGISYKKEVLLSQEFVGGAPQGLAPRDYFQGHYANLLLDANGSVYFRCPYYGSNTDFFTYSFANFPMMHEGTELKIDRIIPCVAENTFFLAVYQTTPNRVLFMFANNESLAGGLVPARVDSYTGTYLDYNDMGNAELLYTSFYNMQMSGWNGAADNIMLYRDKNGDVHIQRCSVEGDQMASVLPAGIPVTNVRSIPFSGQSFINANTRYYQTRKGSTPYLFFATGNNLYWYNLDTDQTSQCYTLPAGSEVIRMNCNRTGSELGLALTNGQFIILDISYATLSGGSAALLYESATLPGTIIDMEYKYSSLGAYTSY
jgi:hypothetical protein